MFCVFASSLSYYRMLICLWVKSIAEIALLAITYKVYCTKEKCYHFWGLCIQRTNYLTICCYCSFKYYTNPLIPFNCMVVNSQNDKNDVWILCRNKAISSCAWNWCKANETAQTSRLIIRQQNVPGSEIYIRVHE